MSEDQFRWTAAQKVAFSFIKSGIERGMTATSALTEYRSGGGKIRNQSWYSLYKSEFAFSGVRENVTRLPNTYIVTEPMFEPTDFDYQSKYVMTMKVSGWSNELQMRIIKYVTVESDILVTKAEWRYGAQQAVNDTLGSPDFLIDRIWDYDPRVRMSSL